MSDADTKSTSDGAANASKKSRNVAGHDKPVYAEDLNDLLARLGASSNAGLEEAEAIGRLAKYGKNRLPEAARKSTLRRLLEQFANPLVLTLLAAAAIANSITAVMDRRGRMICGDRTPSIVAA